jgi:3-phosphoshikimate 1-carboxyvinyltransferase
MGAEITEKDDRWIVRGAAFLKKAGAWGEIKRCNVGNSGTTLFFALAAAALGNEPFEFDGSEQIRRRSAAPLLEALKGAGVNVKSAPNGCTPISVRGPWKGGRLSLSCPTSQYLSAMLLAAPLAPAGVVTEIDVPLLNEKPFVEMTLSYLDSHNITYEAATDFFYFRIPGGSEWKPMEGEVPGDFSSAAFPAAAAVISKGSVTLTGLDPEDTQGDKVFFGFLEKMGCKVKWEKIPGKKIPLNQVIPTGLECTGIQNAEIFLEEWQLSVSGKDQLSGGEFDLNNTPDLLPPLAAVACFALGDTALVNIASARIKETDRIAVMAEELAKLGVKSTETPTGLIIHGCGGIPPHARANGGNKNFQAESRNDHRVFMSLACAALGCPQPVEITGAESVDESYPGFLDMIGGQILYNR